MPILRALKHTNFALLLSGQALSRLGDFIFNIALAWWVLQKTGSALAMSGVMIFGAAPMLIFLLAGGVVVDRFNRAWLLFLSDLGRGGIMLLATWLVGSNRLEVWMVYGGAVFFSLADAFFMPAYTALVPQLTPREDWPSANSLTSLSSQLGRVAGPALGGLLVSMGGTALAFGLNAVSFFVSAALLVPVLLSPQTSTHIEAASQPGAAQETPMASIREGLRIVLGKPILWVTIVVAAFGNIFLAGPFSVGFPFLVKDFMGGDEKTLGLILAIFPIGYILSGLLLGNLKRFHRRGSILFTCEIAAGVGLAAFGFHLPFWLLAAAAILNGAALQTFDLAWVNLLQEVVPNEKLGRVSSIDMLGSFVLLPIGFGLTGLLVQNLGPAPTFILGGLLIALIGAFVLLFPQIRRVD